MNKSADIHVRLANAEDDEFILSLAHRFVDGFELPPWRKRSECAAGIRENLTRYLSDPDTDSHVYVADDAHGTRVGFIHLMTMKDPFSNHHNAHISDLAVAMKHDGQGIGHALLAFAERWARERRCLHLQLAVFPSNTRALSLYEKSGFGVEMLRMMKPLR